MAGTDEEQEDELPDLEDPPDDGTDDYDDTAQVRARRAAAVDKMGSLRSDFISDSSDVETVQPHLANAQLQNRQPTVTISVDSDDDANDVGLLRRLKRKTQKQPPQAKAGKRQLHRDFCSDSSDLDDGLELPTVASTALIAMSHDHSTDATVETQAVDVDWIPVLERKRRKGEAASAKSKAKAAADVRF